MGKNVGKIRLLKQRAIPVLVAAAVSGVSGVGGNVFAADPALEEIIITAQKRAENLQDVPISVLSFDAKALEKKGVVTLSDINDGSVPGLNLAPYPGSTDIFFPTFRGITTNSVFVSAPNPIAVHIDGVFHSQLAGINNPAADLERIEVLKGPQGVMSGRNATGGALNIYTARPELGQFTFKQQLTFAERDQMLSKTIINVPIGETLAAKVSYVHTSRDNEGISNSAPGGYHFGERDADSVRLDLRWKPSNAVLVDYGYDYSLAKGYDTPPQCLYPATSFVNLAAVGDPRINTFIKGCSPSRQTSLYAPFSLDKNRNKVEGHTLNVKWDVSPTFTLRSITGFRKVDTSNNYNYGAYVGGADARSDSFPLRVPGTPFDGKNHPVKLYNEAFSQEFQFLGDIGPTIKYTAGIYYSSEKGHQYSGPNVGLYMPGGSGTPGVDFAMVDDKGLHSARSDSYAVFGQVSWRPQILDQKLEVVPGLRFTRDHRRVDGYNTGWTYGYVIVPTGLNTGMLVAPPVSIAAPNVGFASAIGDRRYSQATPAISLNYHWDPALMTYVKYSKGYTSGGFDPISGPATAAAFSRGFDPETIKSAEAGLKGEFLNRRLRTNLAVFQSKFTNEQKSVALPSGGWKTENVGGSTYSGLELDLTAAISENLRATLSYATLHHKYDKWIDPSTGNDVTAQRRLVVPKNDYTVTVDYRFPDLGLPGRLDGTLGYSHRDATSTPLNLTTPNVALYSTTPAFGIWNGRLALSRIKVGPGSHGDLTVALWAKNLTDKKYLSIAYQGWTTNGSGYWGEPRTVGIDLIYQYF